MAEVWRMNCPGCGAAIALRPAPRPKLALQCASCGNLLDPADAVPSMDSPAALPDDEWEVALDVDDGTPILPKPTAPRPVAAPALPERPRSS